MNLIEKIGSWIEWLEEVTADKIMTYASKNRPYTDQKQYIKDKYKITIFCYNCYKLLLLLLLMGLVGWLRYYFIFMLVFSCIRTYSHGVHLDNDLLCFLWDYLGTLASIYLSLFLSKISLPFHRYIGITVISFIAFFIIYYKYAPAATKKRPIKEKEYKRKKKKSLQFLFLMFIVCIMLFYLGGNKITYSYLILFAIGSQVINILPITFKLIEKEVENE